MADKPKVAICWLGGCGGCDEAVVDLEQVYAFQKSIDRSLKFQELEQASETMNDLFGSIDGLQDVPKAFWDEETKKRNKKRLSKSDEDED